MGCSVVYLKQGYFREGCEAAYRGRGLGGYVVILGYWGGVAGILRRAGGGRSKGLLYPAVYRREGSNFR